MRTTVLLVAALVAAACGTATDEHVGTSSAALTTPMAGGSKLPPGISLRMPLKSGTTAKITNAYGAGYHVGVNNGASMNQYYALDLYPLPNGGFGEPIVAPADGVVKLAGAAPGGWATCGNWVVTEHDFGDGHKYLSNICHMSAVLVSVGQHVKAGDTLGKIGCASDLGNPPNAASCSPDRWGPHVHISVQRDASIAGGSYGGSATVPELMDGYSNFVTGMTIVAKGAPPPPDGGPKDASPGDATAKGGSAPAPDAASPSAPAPAAGTANNADPLSPAAADGAPASRDASGCAVVRAGRGGASTEGMAVALAAWIVAGARRRRRGQTASSTRQCVRRTLGGLS